ncbi:MAG: MBOAT family protein [Lachnospiraceae bacterium]|nr:MBOAT family protein [Lachnospiraceae bacterium]
MLFNSVSFLIFFPIVVLIYFFIPQRVKYLWLLGASYFFYMSWNPRYALLILASTVTTWGSALLLSKCGKWFTRHPQRAEKWCLAGCAALNLGILFFFKYYVFTVESIEKLFSLMGVSVKVPVVDVLLPVGISFYTFQALGYIIDVYRREIPAEKNLLRYALFISFFPQLVAGPIERSKNLMYQIYQPHVFDFQRVKGGLLLMGWGFFQKLVIADRIAILVNDVYGNYHVYSGLQILLATMLFAFQIYCDFAGYSDIAIGAARVMGFTLTKNFKSPYFATTVSDFWRSWHISLTTWFRDYVYIPLGGNRCGKWKKYRNLLLTFAVSGLWHGAGWNFVVWGALNGLYQAAGDLTLPVRTRLQQRLHIRTQCGSYRLLQGIITFGLVDFTWLFFRAESFTTALRMLWHGINNIGLFSFFNPDTLLGIQTMALSEKNFFVMLLGLAVLLLVDYKKKQNVDFKGTLARQNIWFRWLVYYGLIFVVLIFGIYGPEYDASTFIYFQF